MAENTNNDDNNTEKLNIENTKYKIGKFTLVEDFTKNGFSSIVEATKSINQFPNGATRDLYCAYPIFSEIVDTTSDRILQMISRVLKHQNIRGNIQRRQQDEQFELLTECNDVMLEKISSNLDEMAGIKRNPENNSVETPIKVDIVQRNTKGIGSWNLSKTSASSSQSSILLLNAKNIPRPQLNFIVPIDNSPDTPFEPKIKEKPNALKPLAILPEYDEDGNIESYIHPYEFELLKFEPSIAQLEKKEPKLPKKIENTAFELIETKEQLEKLIYTLRDINEIAVDVEHHSLRSFMGISCLIQLSTKLKDYIIDGLKLRDDLYILNEIFTNPKITKIFHGADLDIQWLQRDFGVYVVNMFDTHQAAKMLGLPRLSLAYLLKHFCDIDADKSYQLADWRMRPLPEELIYYARQDTHYLIYIYELLCNELINKGNDQSNLIKMVYQRSVEICKKRYIKPKISPDSHMDMYRKSKRVFDNRQLFALKEIFQWRDFISRKEDESYNYVLPNHMMLQIAEILPREMQGILACCNPIPSLVRQNLHTLHQIILKARDQPLIKPIINEEIENRVINTNDINNRLYCFHDMFHNQEFRDDLPTLLDSQEENSNKENPPVFVKPIVSVFENLIFCHEESVKNKLAEIKKVKFITPYERYKAIIPYAEKLNMEEIEKQEAMRKSMQLCPASQGNSSKETKEEKNNNDEGDKIRTKKDLKRKQDNSLSNTQITSSKKAKKSETNKIDKNDLTKHKNNCKKEEQNVHNNTSVEAEGNRSLDRQEIKEEKSESEAIVISSDDDNGKQQQADSQVKQQITSNSAQKNVMKKKKFLAKLKTGQSSNQPVQFDYSKVNFNKFKGGVEKMQSNATNTLKSKFKAKGKTATNINKKFNKLFSFSKGNKK